MSRPRPLRRKSGYEHEASGVWTLRNPKEDADAEVGDNYLGFAAGNPGDGLLMFNANANNDDHEHPPPLTSSSRLGRAWDLDVDALSTEVGGSNPAGGAAARFVEATRGRTHRRVSSHFISSATCSSEEEEEEEQQQQHLLIVQLQQQQQQQRQPPPHPRGPDASAHGDDARAAQRQRLVAPSAGGDERGPQQSIVEAHQQEDLYQSGAAFPRRDERQT
jgi:hypothetical protein